jgi:hypothetical protein
VKRAIGLAALTVLELPHEEQIRVAAQAGYSHVGCAWFPWRGSRTRIRFICPPWKKDSKKLASVCSTSKCSG